MDKNKRAAKTDAASIARKLKQMLLKNTYKHTAGVAKTAVMLAGRFGADRNRTAIAGLLHDCAKDMDVNEMKFAIKKYGVKLKNAEKKISAIWHGLIGEKIAEKEFGIKDKQVLRAIRIHSTGNSRMGRLEKIIYVSDFIEPGREYKGSKKIRKLLKRNISLDRLMLYVVKEKINYLNIKEQEIHPATLELLNEIFKQ